jgi:hypothetical protein
LNLIAARNFPLNKNQIAYILAKKYMVKINCGPSEAAIKKGESRGSPP